MKIVTVSSEFGVTLLFLLVQFFYFDLNSPTKKALEMVILTVMSSMAVINLAVTAYFTYLEVRKVLEKAKSLWSQRTRVLNGSRKSQSIAL